jgi:pimeloyl-ACP methyl ester carboxylesterase
MVEVLVTQNPFPSGSHTTIHVSGLSREAGSCRTSGEQGYLLVDGEFELGWVLFQEFRHYRPLECFQASRVPALVVHGDRDTYVSYGIARAAADRPGCVFHTVAGSDHGFDSRGREDEAIEASLGWLVRRHARSR